MGLGGGRVVGERCWVLRLHSDDQQVDGSEFELEEIVKSLATTLPLTLALGGLVAGVALLLPLEAESRTSSLIGALLASLVGGLVMVIKSQLAGAGLAGPASVKSLLTAQVSTFLLRLLAVGVGAAVLKGRELSPVAFAIAFMVVSLLQQMLETHHLLAGTTRSARVKPEVIS